LPPSFFLSSFIFSFTLFTKEKKTMPMFSTGVETPRRHSPDGPDQSKVCPPPPPRDSCDLPSLLLSSCYPITLKVLRRVLARGFLLLLLLLSFSINSLILMISLTLTPFCFCLFHAVYGCGV
jgi:hypothetical protein